MKKGIFWKIYVFFFLLAAIAIGSVWYLLYDFLIAYEAAQPIHTMEAVMPMFTEGRAEDILSYTIADYSESKKDEVIESVSQRIAGKEIIFGKKFGEYSDEVPAYSIRDEEGEICVVYLKAKAERAKYDSKIWELDRIENLVHVLDPIDIIAPENYIVEVNGTQVDDSYMVSSEMIEEVKSIEEYDLISTYTDFPSIVSYHMEEFYVEPVVTCYTPDGAVELEPNVDAPDRTYQYESVYYETIDEDMAQEIKDFSHKYVNYVTRDEEAAEVLKYVLPKTVTYERLEKIEKMNKWTPKHKTVQFSDMEIYDYRTYSDCFFTCKNHFTYMIPYRMGDSEYETDLTFYYLLVDGKWKIVEMLIE